MGTGAGTCRSPGASDSLGSATRRPTALQGSGLAARPRARRRSGQESRVARRRPSVFPSRPAGARGTREPRAGRGGAGRSVTAPRVPAPPATQLRPAARARRSRGRPLAAGAWRCDRRTDGWTERGRPAGRAPRPRPKCRVTPGAARPVRGGAGARPAPPTCAPSLARSTATPWETDLLCGPRSSGNRVSKVARPRRHCKCARIFLGSREAPTCFRTKCEGRKIPTSWLFTTSPAA